MKVEDASGFQGYADRVVAPSNTEELRGIVAQCTREKIPLTISGAGTGLTGARVPSGGWLLSLEKFRRLEVQSGKAICGAAVTLQDLHAESARMNQFLGPNPTEISASVGGVVATNAGGARSFHYGAMRKQVLALEVTFMNGETRRFQRGELVDFPYTPVPAPAVTKNSAGYFLPPNVEWVDLLSGAEGTLGIINEAELMLHPIPPQILSGVVFFTRDEDAIGAVEGWRGIAELRLLEYLDANSLQILRAAYPELPDSAQAALMIEQNLTSGDDAEIDLWPERLRHFRALEDESWFGLTAADRERFRKFRHTLAATVVERARKAGQPKYGTDFAVPVTRLRELHAFYRERCETEFPGSYAMFGHAGDANNHVNLIPETAEDGRRASKLIDEFAAKAVSLGGTVAAEHGVGRIKADLLRLMYSPAQLDAMRAVKAQLDPDWLLGRGVIFSAAQPA